MSSVMRIIRTIGYKLGVSVLTILGASLVTHYLASVGDFGIYSTVKNTLLFGSFYFIAFTRFFNYGMNRLKLDRQSTVSVAVRFFLQISVAVVPLALIAFALAGLSSIFLYAGFVFGTLFFVLLFGFCANLLQALNEIDWLNRVNVIQIASFSVLIGILFVLDRTRHLPFSHQLIWTLSLWLFSNILAALITVAITRRLAGVRFRPRRDPEISRGMFAYGKKVALQNVLTQLNYRGDAYMVIWLAGTTAAGLYSPAVTSSEVLWQISTSVALIVYTRVAAHEKERSIELTERTFRFTFWFLVVTAAAMYLLFSPLIHLIYGARYAGSVPAFQVLLIGTTAYGMIGLLTQFFTDQMGKVTYPVYMQFTSIAVNLALCVILIPRIGMLGGAIGSTSGYTVALIMSIIYFKRLTGRPLRHLFLFTANDRQLLSRLRPGSRSLNESVK
ncbi:MAG: oligosaccharide flippase family protein [Firmicutes bacterium]|nr:oligosaccharide flippase family protein [Bacillota bacterium]